MPRKWMLPATKQGFESWMVPAIDAGKRIDLEALAAYVGTVDAIPAVLREHLQMTLKHAQRRSETETGTRGKDVMTHEEASMRSYVTLHYGTYYKNLGGEKRAFPALAHDLGIKEPMVRKYWSEADPSIKSFWHVPRAKPAARDGLRALIAWVRTRGHPEGHDPD
jgi:hypothetical protein